MMVDMYTAIGCTVLGLIAGFGMGIILTTND